jgi:hypothetical protein
MDCGLPKTRQVGALRRAGVVLAATFIALAASSASASILQSNFGADAVEIIAQIDASSTGTGATSSTSSNTTEPSGWPAEQSQSDELEALNVVAPSSGGSTSSSSSSPVGGGASASALLENVAEVPVDSSNAERVAFERELFLPDAPGNELLRPPQGL